jgi:uncharacterized membrane protein YbhN (UPF0104 family)
VNTDQTPVLSGTEKAPVGNRAILIKRFSGFFSYLLYAGICAYLLITHYHTLPVLLHINVPYFIVLIIITLLFVYISGYCFTLTVQLYGITMNVKETFGLAILNNLGGYLMPYLPGAALRAVYLKKTKNLAYLDFSGALIALLVLTNFVFALVGLWIVNRIAVTPAAYRVLTLCCFVLLLSPCVPVAGHFFVRRRTDRFSGMIGSLLSFINNVRSRSNQIVFIKLFLVTCGGMVVTGVTCMISCEVFHYHISFFQGLTIAIFTAISGVFSITPNNIGIQEALSCVLLMSFGYSKEIGIASALIVRFSHVIAVLSLSPVFYRLLFSKNGIRLFDFIHGSGQKSVP